MARRRKSKKKVATKESLGNEKSPPQSIIYSEYKQSLWLRWVNVAFMIALGITLNNKYEDANYKLAQQLLYVSCAVGFFAIVYLKLRMWTRKTDQSTTQGLRSWSIDYLLTVIAIILIFVLIFETMGWYDKFIGVLVDIAPDTPGYVTELISFLVVASITGVIGNLAYSFVIRVFNPEPNDKSK
jgi:L-asparagine transporter-like permease